MKVLKFESNRSFGFYHISLNIREFHKLIHNEVVRIAKSEMKIMSQPCSIHGTHCSVKGNTTIEYVDRLPNAVMRETHHLYNLTEQTKAQRRFIESLLGSKAWDPDYTNWTMRCGCSVNAYTHIGRLLKLSEPYKKENYEFIRHVHNDIVLPNIGKFLKYKDIIINKLDLMRNWTFDDWKNLNPKVHSKESGPQFAEMLRLSYDTEINEIIEDVNEYCESRNVPKFDFSDKVKWSWKFVYYVLNCELEFPRILTESFRKGIASALTNYVQRLYEDAVAIYMIENERMARPFPDEWEDWEVDVIIPHKLAGVTRGKRDSCDVEKIEWTDDSVIVDVKEDAQRIVVREIASLASAAGLNDLAAACMRLTNGKYVGNVQMYCKALYAKGGLDGAKMDSVTGATMGLVSYARFPISYKPLGTLVGNVELKGINYSLYTCDIEFNRIKLISIAMGSGRPETQPFDTQILYEMHVYAKTISYIIYIMGDDQGTNVFPTDNIVKIFNKAMRINPDFEFLKAKQSSWVIENEIWINFVLGISVVYKRQGSVDEVIGYFRAIKTLATKQSPEGIIETDAFRYNYIEIRSGPNFDDLYDDQAPLFRGSELTEIVEFLKPYEHISRDEWYKFLSSARYEDWPNSLRVLITEAF